MVWCICSAIYALLFIVFWTRGIRRASRLEPEETNQLQLLLVIVTGTMVILLLLVNAIILQAFWPFATGLVYQTGLALSNFFGLLQRAMSDDDAS
jgi:hypothetical protein